MPDSLRHLEGPLREQLRSSVQRGKVDAQLRFHPNVAATNSITINEEILKQLQITTPADHRPFS